MNGLRATTAKSAAEMDEHLRGGRFDLVILDVMMPGEDGLSAARRLSAAGGPPILMLSARSGSADRVAGLKRGADDYLTKPFNLEELLLRVDKLIDKNRRLHEKTTLGDHYAFGGNSIDFKAQTATNAKGDLISLSKKEIMLLKLMIEYRNEVVSREKILQAVWGYQVFPTTRTIDNFILNFRKYFETDPREPRHFHSVRGVGYKFADA
jgi:two-component system alkaline phosphatase synthesis response regulator PhoP